MSILKYWIPAKFETEGDSRSIDKHAVAAEDIASDFWNNYSGYEETWPIEFHYRINNGQGMSVVVSIVGEPGFVMEAPVEVGYESA